MHCGVLSSQPDKNMCENQVLQGNWFFEEVFSVVFFVIFFFGQFFNLFALLIANSIRFWKSLGLNENLMKISNSIKLLNL